MDPILQPSRTRLELENLKPYKALAVMSDASTSYVTRTLLRIKLPLSKLTPCGWDLVRSHTHHEPNLPNLMRHNRMICVRPSERYAVKRRRPLVCTHSCQNTASCVPKGRWQSKQAVPNPQLMTKHDMNHDKNIQTAANLSSPKMHSAFRIFRDHWQTTKFLKSELWHLRSLPRF